jgi:hypothetical protein
MWHADPLLGNDTKLAAQQESLLSIGSLNNCRARNWQDNDHIGISNYANATFKQFSMRSVPRRYKQDSLRKDLVEVWQEMPALILYQKDKRAMPGNLQNP